MKRFAAFAAALMLLTLPVLAADMPRELAEALPEEIAEAAQGGALLADGAAYLFETARQSLRGILRESARGAAALMLAALLCGMASGLDGTDGGPVARCAPYFGVLAVATLSAGDLSTLIGLGVGTMNDLSALSAVLMPAVAASIAAGGFVSTASVWQATTLMASNLLIGAIRDVLLPLVYCCIGLAAADAVLADDRLKTLAEGLRKAVEWALSAALVLFSAYLSLSNVLAGSADRMAVRAAKAVVSGLVPVVGGILSDAAESVLAGATALRGTIGAAGVLAILAVSLTPLLRLGIQFLLYKAAAFAAAMVGTKEMQKFLDSLGGAFALVFAMTASCALLLLVAMLVSTAMVTA